MKRTKRAVKPPEPEPERIGSDKSLALERQLIQRARTAIRKGEHDAALAALDHHRRRFPRGRLLEERSALRVVALSRLRLNEEAALEAARFRSRWPESIFRRLVDEATEGH